MFLEAFDSLIAMQGEALRQDEDTNDYVEGGLLHCGLCRTPKQCHVTLPPEVGGGERFPPVMCKCRRAAFEAEEARAKARELQDQISRIRSASLMDARFEEASFDKLVVDDSNRQALKLCKNYAESFEAMERNNQGMLFYGPPGTGKTYAAACIANALIGQNIFVMLTSFVKLMRIAYKGGDEWGRLTANLQRARLLIIDDLGAERETDTALEHVYGIVDDRYRAQKPVIFTTNLKLSDLKSPGNMRVARIYDRVLETCYPVAFTGVSWRQNEAAKRFEQMRAFLEEPEK